MLLLTDGIVTAKVKSLPVNTSLQFEFTTGKAGYVTLLNIACRRVDRRNLTTNRPN